MNLLCVVCKSKLIAISKTKTKCSNACEFDCNLKQLKELNLVCVYNEETMNYMSWDRWLEYKGLANE